MDNALKLRVVFDMVDKMTKPLKTMLAGNKGLAGSLKETRDELAKLDKQQKNINGYKIVRGQLSGTVRDLKEAREKMRGLQLQIQQSDAPSAKMRNALNAASRAVVKLSEREKEHSNRLTELRNRMQDAGRGTQTLAAHESDVRGKFEKTTAAIKRQEEQLRAIGDREKRIGDARKSMQKMQGVAGGMAVGGYAAKSTGAHIFGDLHESLDQAKEYQREAMRIKALGLGDHASADAVKYASSMNTYGVSTNDNMVMMRDALSIFADEHHAQMVMPTLAKMKFANDSMFGAEDAHANEEKFMNMLKVIELRGGTKNEGTFKDEANMVQKVITATGGRVGGDEWRNFIQTGGVAAKQLRKDAFYYQMEPLIQEMGGHAVGTGLMSAYSNVYQGKTTVRAAKQMMSLGLLDPKMVEYTKIGTIKQVKPGALAGGDQLKASPLEWLEKVLLPKLAAKGITDPDKVKDMISTIFTNRTAANLFTTMYMQRDQIHKSERLNTGADGVDEGAAKGRELAQGRELETLHQLKDLQGQIGDKILPSYNAALDITANATAKVVGFMKEHETAARVILTALAALAAILVVCGTLTIALAGVLGPMAVVKFSMQTLGMQGGLLSRSLGLAGSAFRMFGMGAMWAGRAMLMNPIGLAITAAVAVIAGAAYLIYRYWEPITAFFGSVWGNVKAAFAGAIGSVTAMLVNWSLLGLLYQAFSGVMSLLGIELPGKFTEFGGYLITGLVNGISSRLGAVKDAIVNVASSTIGWFKEKLGIHSPSRVFGELGGFISQGAAIGMEGEQGRIAKAAVGLATVATTAFGAPAFANGVGMANTVGVPLVRPTTPIDRRAPLTAASGGAGATVAAAASPSPIVIQIYPQAGDDPQAIARAVSAELDRRERMKRSRATSSLSDH